MPNKKRQLATYVRDFGRFHLHRKDILLIEKIFKEYAAAYDAKILNRYPDSELKQRLENQTRKFADVHVEVGRWKSKLVKFGWNSIEIDYTTVRYIADADSIKFLPKYIRSARYFKVACHPGMWLIISPLKCELRAQRGYATGSQLRAMDSAIQRIESHFDKCKNSVLNRVIIR